MKHIFYVHSYVTYLVTLGIVEHKKISDKDVLLITARGGVNQSRFSSIDVNQRFPKLFGIPCYGTKLFYIKNHSIISSFDKSILRFCENDSFACYIPSDGHYLQQLLSTHSKCRRVYFMEEGLFSYNDEYRKKSWPFAGFKGVILRFLNTGNRNHHPSSIVDTAILFTLFNVESYEGPIKKICVMPDVSKIEYTGIRLKDSSILMMNAFKDASPVVIDKLLSIIEYFAVEKKRKNETIYIKHHPYSDLELQEKVEHIFRDNGVPYRVLDNKLNTELMLFHSENLSIYGFFSAAMLYGALMGHKAISFTRIFESSSSECASYLQNNFHIPSVFIKNSTMY